MSGKKPAKNRVPLGAPPLSTVPAADQAAAGRKELEESIDADAAEIAQLKAQLDEDPRRTDSNGNRLDQASKARIAREAEALTRRRSTRQRELLDAIADDNAAKADTDEMER